MKHKLILIYIFFFATSSLYAQEKKIEKIPSKHSVYIDLQGKTSIASITYEYELHRYKNSTLVQSIGFFSEGLGKKNNYLIGGGHIIEDQRRLKTTFYSYSLNWISHLENQHHVEAGVGFTYLTGGSMNGKYSGPVFNFNAPVYSGHYFSPNIGYRYTAKKGFLFRAFYCPAISNLFYPHYQHLAGISLGYNFRMKSKDKM